MKENFTGPEMEAIFQVLITGYVQGAAISRKTLLLCVCDRTHTHFLIEKIIAQLSLFKNG